MVDSIGYGVLIEQAMLSVVKLALKKAQIDGLPAEHHFYITFITDYEGVEISNTLRSAHPGEMTIVLQNQFWNLQCHDTYFEVVLSFNKVGEKLKIPFDSLLSFSDPSVQFALHFNSALDDVEDGEAGKITLEKTTKNAEIINLADFKKST